MNKLAAILFLLQILFSALTLTIFFDSPSEDYLVALFPMLVVGQISFLTVVVKTLGSFRIYSAAILLLTIATVCVIGSHMGAKDLQYSCIGITAAMLIAEAMQVIIFFKRGYKTWDI